MTAKGEVFILYVEDVGRARRFYEGALGLRPRLEAGGYCELDLGGVGLGFLPRAALPRFIGVAGERPWTDGAPRCELYLLVDDLEAAIRGLESAHAPCLSPVAQRDWGDRAAYYQDPDGHVVAVARRSPGTA